MHKHRALWIRGCLINVRNQSIAWVPCDGTPSLLLLHVFLSFFLSISCHIPSSALLIVLFISPCLCPKVTKKGTYSRALVNTLDMTEIKCVWGWKQQLTYHRENTTGLSKENDFASLKCYVLTCCKSKLLLSGYLHIHNYTHFSFTVAPWLFLKMLLCF